MKRSDRSKLLTMSELVRTPSLRAYLSNVRDWHGYIRFLGLPDRRDNPDILIDRLFVEPLLLRRHMLPDEDPAGWIAEAETIFDVLGSNQPIILLGDPGSGKSTLLNYLVWLLARPTGDTWKKRMGEWLLPVPMVLRELSIRGIRNFSELLEAFMGHPMSEPLRHDNYFSKMLESGRALILLDGIDELGDSSARKHLRDAVLEGLKVYPWCKWLLSSRIVGYDEVPFELPGESVASKRESQAEAGRRATGIAKSRGLVHEQNLVLAKPVRESDLQGQFITRYIAPFDNPRIEAFARNWYTQREAVAIRAGENADHLVRAVHADDAILRLARIPNLLTMMALIHRVEATLPHGRTLLYERIAEAYLESIDKFRGVYSGAYNLSQKRRWLARVAFEMQRRRSADIELPDKEEDSELLAEFDDVISWLEDEMMPGSENTAGMSAREFLDFVGRRSGLFLPRSEGRYAFVHLSFQEYFAAVAMERDVTGIQWARGGTTHLGLERDKLSLRARQSVWFETFAFLFELVAPKSDWHDELVEAIFGAQFALFTEKASNHDPKNLDLARLLARLAVNPRSGLTEGKRDVAIGVLVRTAFTYESRENYLDQKSNIIQDLLGDDIDWNMNVLQIMVSEVANGGARRVDLSGTRIVSIDPFAALSELEFLSLADTRVSDLKPLSNLRSLRTLKLSGTQVSDLGIISKMVSLESLSLGNTPVKDLVPLAGLGKLRRLGLADTKVDDISPLTNVVTLETLILWNTGISDLRPLAGLTALESLDLDGTQILDLGPLAGLHALESLDLRGTRVSDLSPLCELTSLDTLRLWDTSVTDLKPLRGLTALRALDLDGTRVTDFSPLAELPGLESLDLRNMDLTDAVKTELEIMLPNCELTY